MGGLLKQDTPKWELIGEGNYKKRGSIRSLFLEKETHYKWELLKESIPERENYQSWCLREMGTF